MALDKKKILILAIVILALALVSAAGFFALRQHNAKGMTETALRMQAEKYWKARVAGDLKAIYYITDDRFRAAQSVESYARSSNQEIKSFKIQEIKINEKEKSANVRTKFKTSHMGLEFEPVVNELWVYEGSEWHINYSDTFTPFGSLIKMKK